MTLSRAELSLSLSLSMSDDEDEDVLASFRPQMNVGAPAVASDSDDEAPAAAPPPPEEEESAATGLLDANAAFDDDAASSLELDPFRAAGPVASAPKPDETTATAALKAAAGKKISNKIFVGGLSLQTTEAALLKHFTRYGKVAEATVVMAENGKSRGFGFVTFVHQKGAAYCVQQVSEPGQQGGGKISIDGRNANVRFAEESKGGGVPHFKMPARGQYNHKPRELKSAEQRAPGGIGGGGAGGGAGGGGSSSAGGSAGKRHGDSEEYEGKGKQQRVRRSKEELVTVTRRPDAEALYDKPITLRELFPKEFWRI